MVRVIVKYDTGMNYTWVFPRSTTVIEVNRYIRTIGRPVMVDLERPSKKS